MKSVAVMGVVLGMGAWCAGGVVQLDMSSAFNYDAVGTQREVSALGGVGTLAEVIGDHDLTVTNERRAYTNLGSVSSGTALPDNGIIGPFQISTAFDDGVDGTTKQKNAFRIRANNATTTTTYTLPAAQQANYADLTLLFVAQRSTSSGTFRTIISARYTDGSTDVLFDSGSFTGSTAGGTLSSAGVGGGGLTNGVDPSEDVSLALTMTNYLSVVGSPARSSIRNVTPPVHLWQLAEPFQLNADKTLEGVTFSLSASSGRTNMINVFAMNATEAIPEPTSAVLLAGLTTLILGRRRRA